MSAHFFTSLHPRFKQSGTYGGVGKQAGVGQTLTATAPPSRENFEKKRTHQTTTKAALAGGIRADQE